MASCSTNLCNGATPINPVTIQEVFNPGLSPDNGCQITSLLNATLSSVGPSANAVGKNGSNKSQKAANKAATNKIAVAASAASVPSSGAASSVPAAALPIEEAWKLRQHTLKKNRLTDTKTKLWLIYGHGKQDVDNFFVIPEGYYIYFDNMSGELGMDNIEKGNTEEDSTNIELDLINPRTRNNILIGNNFIRMFQPGDLINQHIIEFKQYEATRDDHKGTARLLTGIIPPTVKLYPEEFTYDTTEEPDIVIQSKYYNKKLKVDEKFLKKEVNTYMDISICQRFTLSELLKQLAPGHYFIKICRSWQGDYTPAENSNPIRGSLSRQLSTTGRPSNVWSEVTMHSLTVKQYKNGIKSSTLFNTQPHKSRIVTDVFVTREPRQNFYKQICRYNDYMVKTLKTYVISPVHADSVPQKVDDSNFAVLNYLEVHRVLSFNSCSWCHKNLTLVSSSKKLCANCRLACFCCADCFTTDEYYSIRANSESLTRDFEENTNSNPAIQAGFQKAKLTNIQPVPHTCLTRVMHSRQEEMKKISKALFS
jgi:hypothetical protein